MGEGGWCTPLELKCWSWNYHTWTKNKLNDSCHISNFNTLLLFSRRGKSLDISGMLMCRQQPVEPYPLITPHPHPDWGMCVYIQVVVLSTDSLQSLQQLFTVLCEDDTVRKTWLCYCVQFAFGWYCLQPVQNLHGARKQVSAKTVDSACVRMCMLHARCSQVTKSVNVFHC